jgi:primosomal protein DnaI
MEIEYDSNGLPIIDEDKIKEIKSKNIKKIYQNEKLNNFIEQNNISQMQVYNYLDAFIKALESLERCKNCPGLNKCKTKGFINELYKDEKHIYTSPIQCKKCKEKARLKDKFILNSMDDEVYSYSMSDTLLNFKDDRKLIVANLARIIKSDDLSKGVYVCGESGRGKSFIMQVFAKTIADHLNKLCCYVDARKEFPYLINIPSWKKDDYFEEVELLETIDLLFIDNFAEETLLEDKYADSSLVLEILRKRQEKNLPTFFTSKFVPSELPEVYKMTKNGVKNGKEIASIIEETTKTYCLKSMKYPF